MTTGCCLLMDFRTRRIIRAEGNPDLVLLPGSTIKPFTLAALLTSNKLHPGEKFPCPMELNIAGRKLTCSHPRMSEPLNVRTAIAYSCNCYVAHFAERLDPGELARYLAHSGFAPTRLSPAATLDSRKLQALGESHVSATPHDLLFAYRSLASGVPDAILEGLEGAVEFGTAQRAAVPDLKVAGKTGTAPGNAAWFAGFAPSRDPRLVAVILTGGRSGGADAAPLAAKLFADHMK